MCWLKETALWPARAQPTIQRERAGAPVAEVVDVCKIPGFLCRQSDLLIAA